MRKFRRTEDRGQRAEISFSSVAAVEACAHVELVKWYGLEIEDRHLLALLEQRRPAHVLVAIGSGPQEKLAHYIIERLGYRPAIHCIGAALGFITGDQITIPDWADRLYLGWFLRLLRQPRVFIPRLARGFELPWLIWKYGENLPPMRQGGAPPVDSMPGAS